MKYKKSETMILRQFGGACQVKGLTIDELLKKLAKKFRCSREKVTIEIDGENVQNAYPKTVWIDDPNCPDLQEFCSIPRNSAWCKSSRS